MGYAGSAPAKGPPGSVSEGSGCPPRNHNQARTKHGMEMAASLSQYCIAWTRGDRAHPAGRDADEHDDGDDEAADGG
jgi:hypothetical protein